VTDQKAQYDVVRHEARRPEDFAVTFMGDATSFITWAFMRDVTVRLPRRFRRQETTMETTLSRAQDFTISIREIWQSGFTKDKAVDADVTLRE
jgi:hypothetical protein